MNINKPIQMKFHEVPMTSISTHTQSECETEINITDRTNRTDRDMKEYIAYDNMDYLALYKTQIKMLPNDTRSVPILSLSLSLGVDWSITFILRVSLLILCCIAYVVLHFIYTWSEINFIVHIYGIAAMISFLNWIWRIAKYKFNTSSESEGEAQLVVADIGESKALILPHDVRDDIKKYHEYFRPNTLINLKSNWVEENDFKRSDFDNYLKNMAYLSQFDDNVGLVWLEQMTLWNGMPITEWKMTSVVKSHILALNEMCNESRMAQNHCQMVLLDLKNNMHTPDVQMILEDGLKDLSKSWHNEALLNLAKHGMPKEYITYLRNVHQKRYSNDKITKN